MPSAKLRLGPVQLAIVRVLWQRGEATARELTDELARSRPITHSTVQTLLRQLESKGAVGHEVRGRTFVYRALVSEGEVTRRAAQDLLHRLFGGSPAGLVAYLLRHEKLSRDDLREIRRLIEQKEGTA